MLSDTPWIRSFKARSSTRLRLFCFPYAGGGSSIFQLWQGGLPPYVEVCLVLLPGRENRFSQPAFTDIRPLIEALAKTLQPYTDIPCAFFGHSMGALLSFELARAFRRQQVRLPHLLFASAHRAPQLPHPDAPIYHLPDAEFITRVRHLNGMAEEILQNAELLDLLLPLLRADFQLCDRYTYTPEPPLSCSLSVFGGVQDSTIGFHALAAWRAQTTQDFTLRMLPGDHFFLHRQRQSLLHLISQDIRTQFG